MRSAARALAAVVCAALCAPSAAQTYSTCNPLQSSSCPPDSALGKSVNIDFTSGASDSFTASGNPTYDRNGASFTVAKSGDSPQLTSKWYIMFGRVDVTLKAAPGAGIVSSFVLQSDDLDEIDWEWLGADASEVQTNYFGKGQTTTYDRAAFVPAANNQGSPQTYTVIWTASQVVWKINGNTVRTLEPSAANNQYPQTPMQLKIGAWSGGDPSNPQGTVEWARGPTDYTKGPFAMQVQSVKVQDYSTGTQYKYGDTSGTWQSIQAVGGKVNSGGSAVDTSAPAITSSSSGNIYPWVSGSASTSTVSVAMSSYPGLPSGWTVTSSGKVAPPSSAPSAPLPSGGSTSSAPASAPALPSASLSEVMVPTTAYDDQGFTTVYAVPAGASTRPKSYDDRGSLITAPPPAPTAAATVPAAAASAPVASSSAAPSSAATSMAANSVEKAAPSSASTAPVASKSASSTTVPSASAAAAPALRSWLLSALAAAWLGVWAA